MIFLAAFKKVANELKNDNVASEGLADILFLSMIDNMICPLLTPNEVLSLACQFVSDGIEAYMLTIRRFFEQPPEKFTWSLTAEDCSNPYNFIPFLLKKYDKTQKKAGNVDITKWLSFVGNGIIGRLCFYFELVV